MAERLTEGTIRFVLHTNLSELHECRWEQPTRPAFESFVVEKRKHTLQHSINSKYSCLKKLRDSCVPCYLDTYWVPPQPILTPNYTTLGKVKRGNCANRAVPSLMFSRASLRFFSAQRVGRWMSENSSARFFNYAGLWGGSCFRAVTSPAPCALYHRSSAGWPHRAACH